MPSVDDARRGTGRQSASVTTASADRRELLGALLDSDGEAPREYGGPPRISTGQGQLAQPEQCPRLGHLDSCSTTPCRTSRRTPTSATGLTLSATLFPGIGAHGLDELTPGHVEQLSAKPYSIEEILCPLGRPVRAAL
jgi:hypothetical protein